MMAVQPSSAATLDVSSRPFPADRAPLPPIMHMERPSRIEGSNNCLLDLPVLGKGKPTHIAGADEMVHGKGSFYKNKQPAMHELLSQYDELSVSGREQGEEEQEDAGFGYSPAASSKQSLSLSSSFADEADQAVLGRMRESMKKNYILARHRPKIGTVPPVTVASGDDAKTYGRKNDFSDGGVRALINGVQEGDERAKSKRRSKSSEAPRQLNYVAMNKRSVQHGLVSAREQFRLRDAVQVEKTVAIGKPRARAEAPRDGRTFGAPSNLDLTLPALLSHEYHKEWTEKQLQRSKSEAELTTKKPLKSGQTRATLLRQKILEPEQPQALWKLSKFERVEPVVSSFRDPSFRQRAFESSKSDGIARSGEQQHGIYIQ